MSEEFDYDLFVIGAGSGGVRSARMSAGYGARVAIAEEYRVGGTCVIRGCVPKKLFAYAARFSHEFEDAAGYGWSTGTAKFDWATLLKNKDDEIARLSGLYDNTLANAGVENIASKAELVSPHEVRLVAQDRIVTAKYILIATGGTPFKPELPGIEHAITSNEAFHIESLPDKIVIVGGGYIAVEFASIFNGLGVDVTLLYRGPLFLRGFDQDLREGLLDEMQKNGIDIRMNTDVTSIEKNANGLTLNLDNGESLAAGEVMYATGRRPQVDGLGAQKLGITCGWNGHMVVDDNFRTSIENIYAVGDVTDRVQLTPVAIREGAAVAETLFNNNPIEVDHDYIPTAVFSTPELGTIGLTEEEAREKFNQVDIYKSRFRPMKHTLSGRDEKMIMKLIVDGGCDRVIGCHIMGADAAEMVQMTAIAIRMGATKAQFDATMALHPSAAEELVTMRDKWVEA